MTCWWASIRPTSNPAFASDGESSPGDRGGAAVTGGPGNRAVQQQATLGAGRELRGGELSQAKLLLLQAQDQVQRSVRRVDSHARLPAGHDLSTGRRASAAQPTTECGGFGGASDRQPARVGRTANEPRRRLPLRTCREGSVLPDGQLSGRGRLYALHRPDYLAARDTQRVRRRRGECADPDLQRRPFQGSPARKPTSGR
jgi:hypothetical protein